jgi:hypothetical protein
MYKNQSIEEKIHVKEFELQFLSTIKSIDHTCFIHQTAMSLLYYAGFEEVNSSEGGKENEVLAWT